MNIKFLKVQRQLLTNEMEKFNQYGQSAYGPVTENFRDVCITAANKGFTIAGVTCFADTFVQSGSSALRMKFSAKTLRHRKPPNR